MYVTARAVTNEVGAIVSSSGLDIHNLRINSNAEKNQKRIWEGNVGTGIVTTVEQITDIGALPRKLVKDHGLLWVYRYSQIACCLSVHGLDVKADIVVCLDPEEIKSVHYGDFEYRIRGGKVHRRKTEWSEDTTMTIIRNCKFCHNSYTNPNYFPIHESKCGRNLK